MYVNDCSFIRLSAFLPLQAWTPRRETPSWAGRIKESVPDPTRKTPASTRLRFSRSLDSTRRLRPRYCLTSWRRRNCRYFIYSYFKSVRRAELIASHSATFPPVSQYIFLLTQHFCWKVLGLKSLRTLQTTNFITFVFESITTKFHH